MKTLAHVLYFLSNLLIIVVDLLLVFLIYIVLFSRFSIGTIVVGFESLFYIFLLVALILGCRLTSRKLLKSYKQEDSSPINTDQQALAEPPPTTTADKDKSQTVELNLNPTIIVALILIFYVIYTILGFLGNLSVSSLLPLLLITAMVAGIVFVFRSDPSKPSNLREKSMPETADSTKQQDTSSTSDDVSKQ